MSVLAQLSVFASFSPSSSRLTLNSVLRVAKQFLTPFFLSFSLSHHPHYWLVLGLYLCIGLPFLLRKHTANYYFFVYLLPMVKYTVVFHYVLLREYPQHTHSTTNAFFRTRLNTSIYLVIKPHTYSPTHLPHPPTYIPFPDPLPALQHTLQLHYKAHPQHTMPHIITHVFYSSLPPCAPQISLQKDNLTRIIHSCIHSQPDHPLRLPFPPGHPLSSQPAPQTSTLQSPSFPVRTDRQASVAPTRLFLATGREGGWLFRVKHIIYVNNKSFP